MPVILDRPGGEEHKQRLTQIFNAIEAYALTDIGSTVLQEYAQAILISTCAPGAVEPSDNPIKEFIEIINEDLGDQQKTSSETIEQHQSSFQTTVALTIMEALIQHLTPDQLLNSMENVLEHASQLIDRDQMTVQAESPFYAYIDEETRLSKYDKVKKGEILEWSGFPIVAESINNFSQRLMTQINVSEQNGESISLSNSIQKFSLSTFIRVRNRGDADVFASPNGPLRSLEARVKLPAPALSGRRM